MYMTSKQKPIRAASTFDVLLGCENSQAVANAMRAIGFSAYSCDILPCTGGHPEYHIQGDIFTAIDFKKWDAAIFFPPCTHLAVSGAKHFKKKREDGRQQAAIDFFLKLTRTRIPFTAIENPIGIMSTEYRKPDQIIQPWQFGDPFQKSTCLWLNNFPLLQHTKIVDKGDFYISPKGKKLPAWYNGAGQSNRSKTFPGIAQAMAQQWGKFLQESY